MTREKIGKRTDELARQYAKTLDENIKAQLAELSRWLPSRISNSQGGITAARHYVAVASWRHLYYRS